MCLVCFGLTASFIILGILNSSAAVGGEDGEPPMKLHVQRASSSLLTRLFLCSGRDAIHVSLWLSFHFCYLTDPFAIIPGGSGSAPREKFEEIILA